MDEEEHTPAEEIPAVSWFPGHIAKSLRVLREQMKLIDLVLELVDARLPAGSRVPDIDQLTGGKERLLVATKVDLAEPAATRGWQRTWEARGLPNVTVNAQLGKGIPGVLLAIGQRAEVLTQRLRARGRLARPPRVMVVGLPNVGKSSLINRLVRRGKADVADRPGVTRALQWVRITPQVELLDTPGVMPPRLETPLLGLQLALIGCLPEKAFDPVDMAAAGIRWLNEAFPGFLARRYGGQMDSLGDFAAARGFRSGGEGWDTERAARTFLQEFRAGKWGPLTLDRLS